MKTTKYKLGRAAKISEETALPSVLKFLDRYDIDIESVEDEKVREAQEMAVDSLLKSVMFGHMEIIEADNGEIQVKQIIQHSTPGATVTEIIYGELRTKDHIAMPTGENVNQYEKMVGLLSAMATTPVTGSAVKLLRSADAKRAEMLSTLFL